MRVNPVVNIHNGFDVTFCLCVNLGYPHFAWVSPLVIFKKKLFSNKHKKVNANNGTNKGASEAQLCSHVGETPFFIPMLFSRFPQKYSHASPIHKVQIVTNNECKVLAVQEVLFG